MGCPRGSPARYHGFGPSAHGLLFPPGKAPLGLRTANPPSLADYARRIREGRLPWTAAARERLTNVPEFMRAMIQQIAEEIAKLKEETPIVFVDFHAEATSEKVSLGWYLDGRVSAVVGTHTHVQTADERILPGGTAYLTDAGMTGAFDSVIGVRKDEPIEKFLTQVPVKFEVAKNNLRLNGVVVSVDESTGRAVGIERVNLECR